MDPPPSVEDILKRDRERVLEDPALHDEISEDERIFAKEILSRHSPEQIATALLRQHMSNQTAPEELLDEGPPSKPQKQDRNFKNSVWFSLSVGSCLLYTSPSPRDRTRTRMPSSA